MAANICESLHMKLNSHHSAEYPFHPQTAHRESSINANRMIFECCAKQHQQKYTHRENHCVGRKSAWIRTKQTRTGARSPTKSHTIGRTERPIYYINCSRHRRRCRCVVVTSRLLTTRGGDTKDTSQTHAATHKHTVRTITRRKTPPDTHKHRVIVYVTWVESDTLMMVFRASVFHATTLHQSSAVRVKHANNNTLGNARAVLPEICVACYIIILHIYTHRHI